jgi:membrane-bound lytic murein transglycosylase B
VNGLAYVEEHRHFKMKVFITILLVISVLYLFSAPVSAKSYLEGLEVIVIVEKCNLRSTPDTSKKNVIVVLSKNEKAFVMDTLNKEGHLWYLVKTPNYEGWLSASVSTLNKKATHFSLSDLIYKKTLINLEKEYPAKYFNLFNKVKKYYSKKEFDDLLLDQSNLLLQREYLDKLIFLASPVSIKKQNKQHKDWVSILVNQKTLNNGKLFFEKHKDHFLNAQKNTGVQASDILSILNWESRLGKYRGKYEIFKIFINQYFHIDEVEFELFKKGHYQKQGAMDRPVAVKRLQKIKKRALNNLSQLLIWARNTGFDPKIVKGSWAGAIGIPQFMPASMAYAVDGDKDGLIDLNTVPDSIFSVATYLKRHKYKERGREYAFYRYNHSDMYVRGVKLYSDKFKKLVPGLSTME